jgi:hypothetical protein
MGVGTSIKTDKEWQAESDARTLVEAEQIMSDRKRKSAAIKQAKKLAKETERAAKVMSKVSKRKR